MATGRASFEATRLSAASSTLCAGRPAASGDSSDGVLASNVGVRMPNTTVPIALNARGVLSASERALFLVVGDDDGEVGMAIWIGALARRSRVRGDVCVGELSELDEAMPGLDGEGEPKLVTSVLAVDA